MQLMSKSEIKILYKEKINYLKKLNNSYFNNDKPLISDADYDRLKKEIIELERTYNHLGNLSQEIVGSSVKNKFKKIKHLIPMLSLSNAFNESDMVDFLKKINNFLNLKKKKF